MGDNINGRPLLMEKNIVSQSCSGYVLGGARKRLSGRMTLAGGWRALKTEKYKTKNTINTHTHTGDWRLESACNEGLAGWLIV